MDPKQKNTLIFDLDGTLVNIEPMFLEMFNTLAPEFGFSPILPSEIPELKKLGAKTFIQKRVRLPFWKIWFLIRRGKEEYNKRIGSIELFPDIKEILEKLHLNGYRIGIISSNNEDSIQKLVTKFHLPINFVYQSSLFGKASAIKKALQKEKTDISSALYIGDEVRDFEACTACGIDCISVSWGLNSKEALKIAGATGIIDKPNELLSILLREE